MLRPQGPRLSNNFLCFAYDKNNKKLAARFLPVIKSLEADGTITRLDRKWNGDYVRFAGAYDLFVYFHTYILGGAAIIIVSMMLCVLWAAKANQRASAAEREALRRELEYVTLVSEASGGVYDSIFEIDLTKGSVKKIKGDSHIRKGEGTGLPYNGAIGKLAKESVHPDDRMKFLAIFSSEMEERAYSQGVRTVDEELRVQTESSGYYHWYRLIARLFRHHSDNSLRMFLYATNIDEAKRREENLKEEASHDPLTGLLNRRAFSEEAQRLLDSKPAGGCTMYMADVDNLKNINDMYGHEEGDRSLCALSAAIRAAFGKDALAGRYGGDEFMILTRSADPEESRQKCGKLLSVLHDAKTCSPALRFTASIGAAPSSEKRRTLESLLRAADEALYKAKKAGKDRSETS